MIELPLKPLLLLLSSLLLLLLLLTLLTVLMLTLLRRYGTCWIRNRAGLARPSRV